MFEFCFSHQTAKHVTRWCWPMPGLFLATELGYDFHRQAFKAQPGSGECPVWGPQNCLSAFWGWCGFHHTVTFSTLGCFAASAGMRVSTSRSEAMSLWLKTVAAKCVWGWDKILFVLWYFSFFLLYYIFCAGVTILQMTETDMNASLNGEAAFFFLLTYCYVFTHTPVVIKYK